MIALTALSIVIVDAEGHLAGMQKSILRGEGLRKVSMVETSAALLKDLILGRDTVLLNWTDPSEGFVDVIRAVRNKDTSPDPFVGIVMADGGLCRSRVRAALDAGVTSFLSIPFKPADMMRHLQAAAEPQIFVDAPSYFGPDRRRKADPFYEGEERRVSEPKMLAGEDLAQERARMRQTAMSALEVKVSLSA